ncbi:MAG: L-histidine N(alpha)-methyltransferase [Cyclobacteriaceae bacterium]
MDQQFAREVMKGLSDKPKYLSSKYFYDEKGDELFQQIMELDEYYLTKSEYEILDQQKEELLKLFANGASRFSLIEFGAGDGLKTKVLLKFFLDQGTDFKYIPIDISKNAIELLQTDLKKNFAELEIEGLQGEYFESLAAMRKTDSTRKVVLFLGSNIGNFLKPVAIQFLKQIAENLSRGDRLLLGVDLKKDPDKILAAYNDVKGVTKAFNHNLLERINRELGGDFKPDQFRHYPVYDPRTGEARSYLVSTVDQTVNIRQINASFHFKAWESISMELSQKYDQGTLEELARESGFKILRNFYDSKRYFVDSLWEVK